MVKYMIIRQKRTAALLLSALMTLSFPSCARNVSQADDDSVKRPGWMDEKSGETEDSQGEEQSGENAPQTTAVTTTTTTSTTTTTTTTALVLKGNLYDCNGNLLMYSGQREDGSEERFTNDSNKVSFANSPPALTLPLRRRSGTRTLPRTAVPTWESPYSSHLTQTSRTPYISIWPI